ncbi:MAG: terpene cyclase/mutase family protein [Planctomycetota bacterium]|jgi:hypothetical protein|nr:terpene cyclase/mutase family protein [Planctomycetota bacterium]MDP7251214.1 terpene cyclase/mutase family protein [Planctomycetota bacterium]
MKYLPFILIALLPNLCHPDAVAKLKRQRSAQKGLAYLARTQSRSGNWWANSGAYPVAMTSLAGLALAMEGSTPSEGKYAENVAATVDYLISQSQSNGLIGSPRINDRYMYGHGFAMLFLSQIYGEEEDPERRQKLKMILTKGAAFCGKAQTKDGGWGYVSARDGSGFDEGSVTITQVQGLRGAKNAGVVVHKSIIDKAINYIEKCLTDKGGLKYRLGQGSGGERPPITAAGIAVLYNVGMYESKHIPKMMDFCRAKIPLSVGRGSYGHSFYTHLYYSQASFFEGGKTWDNYIAKVGDGMASSQGPDGRWSQNYVGDVFSTAVALIILQLENNTLPIFQK